MNLRKIVGGALVATPFAIMFGFMVAAEGVVGVLFIWSSTIAIAAMFLLGVRILTGQPIR